MLLVIIDIVCAIALSTVGLASGLWLSRRSLRAARHARLETLQAQSVLERIRAVTARTAEDIHAHSDHVRHINDQLTSERTTSSEMIVSTIARLVAANQELRQRLSEADSQLQEQSQQLEFHLAEARIDILTRLPNRRAFDAEAARRYAEYRRNGTPFSLILLDLDHFRRINERQGEKVGDTLLQDVGAALLKTARMVDLVARYDGDKFAILLPGTTIEEACKVATRHQQAIEAMPPPGDDRGLSITASVGVAQLMPSEQVEMTLRRAERALYLAKKAGSNMSLWHDGRAIRSYLAPDPCASLTATESSPEATSESPCSTAVELPQESASAPSQEMASELPPETASEAPQKAVGEVPPEAPGEPRGTTSAGPSRQADQDVPATKAAPTTPAVAAEKPAEQPRHSQGKLLSNECDRTVFVWQLRQGIAQWKRDGTAFSVMLIRVDEYERLRKEHGEARADVALRATRLLLGAAVRDADIVGHYASSCFSVLLPRTPLSEALGVAERIRSGATQCLIPTERGSLEVTMSIALAEVSDGDDVVGLCRRAESALSAAGRNRTCYHDGRSPQIVELCDKSSLATADSCAATPTASQLHCT